MFLTYFQKHYTILRLEDKFRFKKSLFILLKKYEKLDNKKHYYRYFLKNYNEIVPN